MVEAVAVAVAVGGACHAGVVDGAGGTGGAGGAGEAPASPAPLAAGAAGRFPAASVEADVVVVGSGFAGLAAAFEAASAGADVLVLEKMGHLGGNSLISGGGYCCWTSKLKLREKLGLGEDSPELHVRDTLAGGGYYGSPELVEVLAREAPDGLDWLVDAGVEYKPTLARIGGHSAYRSYQADTSGSAVIKLLAAQAQKAGARIQLNTKVEALLFDRRDGRLSNNSHFCHSELDSESQTAGQEIAGQARNDKAASFSQPDGCDRGDGSFCHTPWRVTKRTVPPVTPPATPQKVIRANKAIIIASGGYSRDASLRSAYKPALAGECNCTNHIGATGEMIQCAKAIGADTLHMEFIQLYPCANPANGAVDKPAFLCFSGTGFGLVFVNRAGQRFVNELAGREEVSNAQLVAQASPTFAVLNAEIFKRLGITRPEVDAMEASGRVIAAATLSELAEKAGISPQGLASTAAEHDRYIAQGADLKFAKPMTSQMAALSEGPYYAIPQWPSVHFCMGGLRINAKAQVLDIWGEPMPGVFAAGEATGGLHGNDRLGGNAIAECIVFGRIAGREAAKL